MCAFKPHYSYHHAKADRSLKKRDKELACVDPGQVSVCDPPAGDFHTAPVTSGVIVFTAALPSSITNRLTGDLKPLSGVCLILSVLFSVLFLSSCVFQL